jgi:hypothetical protein
MKKCRCLSCGRVKEIPGLQSTIPLCQKDCAAKPPRRLLKLQVSVFFHTVVDLIEFCIRSGRRNFQIAHLNMGPCQVFYNQKMNMKNGMLFYLFSSDTSINVHFQAPGEDSTYTLFMHL